MAGYVFLGRQRHPMKMLLYQLLTLGVYGRVYLYKVLREFDGHEALFLDRRPYIPLLVLPFIGPLIVKRKINKIVADLVHHDVTTPRYKPGKLSGLAWVPLVPLYHLELQRLLNHHWGMHRKELELELKKSHLAALERSRAEEAAKAAQALAKEIALRERELEDVRKAALALREAEAVRLEAERAAGRRRSLKRANPMALVRKLTAAAASRLPRRGSAETVEAAPGEEASEESAAPVKGKKSAAAPEPAPEPEAEPEEPVEEPGDVPDAEIPSKKTKKARDEEQVEEAATEPVKEKKDWKSFLPFLSKKSDADKETSGTKKAKSEKGPSRAERKEEKRKAKEKAKAKKLAAKEKRKAEKLAAKEAKRAEKEAAKEAKKKEKAAQKEAKAEAKAKATAAKEKAQAAAKKEPKKGSKKEKPAGKGDGKKAAKPKGRSK